MKTRIALAVHFLVACLTSHLIIAQTSPTAWSGQLIYEGIHKIDPSSLKFLDNNGELMKPGDPNFPKDIPDNWMSEQTVFINGPYAKVTGNRYQVMPTAGNRRPFVEQTFIDLKAFKKVTILTVGNGSDAKTYQAEEPLQRISGWQFTDQTKKIAGYTCRKATVPYKKETYSVWVTTDLPITYSPIQELTPDTGTVLLIEGSHEQFKVRKVAKTALHASVVKPGVQAQTVAPGRLPALRQQAIADFTEKNGNGRPGQGG